jgi:hypothetical protein
MVVWKTHGHRPDDDTRNRLQATLIDVVARYFVDEIYVDDVMRAIPDHYHAHARGRGKWGRQPLERRPGV